MMRNRSKRLCILCIVLVAVLAGCMAGCGGKKKKDPTPPPPVTEEFALNHSEYTLMLYDTLQLSVKGYDDVKYASADASIASVDPVSGLVTANKVGGPVVITASKGDLSDTCAITVTQSEYEPELVLHDEEQLYLSIKGTYALDPYVQFGTNTFSDATLIFASSDTNVVTVDENTGLLTGVDIGEATVTVTGTWREFADLSATLTVLVTPALEFDVTVNGESSALAADTVTQSGAPTKLSVTASLTVDGEPVTDTSTFRVITDNADVLEATENVVAIEDGKATVKGRGKANVRVIYTYTTKGGIQYEYKSQPIEITVNAVAKAYAEADNADLVYDASGFTLAHIEGDVQKVLFGAEDMTAKMSDDAGVTFAFRKVQQNVTGGNGDAAYSDEIEYYPYVGEYALTVETSLYDYTADIILASHKISTAAELKAFVSLYNNSAWFSPYGKEHANSVTALTSHYYAVLTADIDMQGVSQDTYGYQCNACFSFNGLGHKIYNYVVSKNFGLFGGIKNATIKNVAVIVTINDGLNGDTTVFGYSYGGAVFDNVFIDATMTGKNYAVVRNINSHMVNNAIVRIRYTGTAGYVWSRTNTSYSGNEQSYVIGNALGDTQSNGNPAYANDNAFLDEKKGELTAANGWNGYWHVTDNAVTFGVSNTPVATRKNIVNITDAFTVAEYGALDLSGKVTGTIPTSITVDGKSTPVTVNGSSVTLPDDTTVGEHVLAIEIGDTLYYLTVTVTKLPETDKTGVKLGAIFAYENLDITSLDITGTYKKATLNGDPVTLAVDGNTVKFPDNTAANTYTVVYTTTAAHYTFTVQIKSFTDHGTIDSEHRHGRGETFNLSGYLTGVTSIKPDITINGKAYSLGDANVAVSAFTFPDAAIATNEDGLPAKTATVYVIDAATENAHSFTVNWEIRIATVQDFLDFIKSYYNNGWEDKVADGVTKGPQITKGVYATFTADLDFATAGSYDGKAIQVENGRGKIPVAMNNAFFAGTFDGQGHSISNLVPNCGIFGNSNRATTLIKNLALVNVRGGNDYWPIFTDLFAGTLENVYISATQVDNLHGIIKRADNAGLSFKNVIVKLESAKAGGPVVLVGQNGVAGKATYSHTFAFSNREGALSGNGTELAYTSDAQFFAEHDAATEFTAANGYDMKYWRVVNAGGVKEVYFGDTVVLADYGEVPAYAMQVLLTTEKLDVKTILGGAATTVKLDGNAVTPDADGSVALTGLACGEHTVFAMNAQKAYAIPVMVVTHKISNKTEMEAWRVSLKNNAFAATDKNFYAVLTADIDYGNTNAVWLSSGSSAQWTNSTFNGQGHVIKNIRCGMTDSALFGGVYSGSVIENVAIINATTENGANNAYILGMLYTTATVRNVYVKATHPHADDTKGLFRGIGGKLENVIADITYKNENGMVFSGDNDTEECNTTIADTCYAIGNGKAFKRTESTRVPYADAAAFFAAVGTAQINAANGWNMSVWKWQSGNLYFGETLILVNAQKSAPVALLKTETLNVTEIMGGGTLSSLTLDGNAVTAQDGVLSLADVAIGEHTVVAMNDAKTVEIPLIVATHKIGTKEEMEAFRTGMKGKKYYNAETFYAVLTADIEYGYSANATEIAGGDAQWTNSTFNGMGHVIKNAQVPGQFFGGIRAGSTLKNISFTGMRDSFVNAPCLLAFMYDSSPLIENVYAEIEFRRDSVTDAGVIRALGGTIKNSVFKVKYHASVAESIKDLHYSSETNTTFADTMYAFGNVAKYKSNDGDDARKPYADAAAFLAAVGETQICAATGFDMRIWNWQDGHLYFGTTMVA